MFRLSIFEPLHGGQRRSAGPSVRNLACCIQERNSFSVEMMSHLKAKDKKEKSTSPTLSRHSSFVEVNFWLLWSKSCLFNEICLMKNPEFLITHTEVMSMDKLRWIYTNGGLTIME